MKTLKELIDFHQSQVKNSQDKEFHRGAVMAFSECSMMFEQNQKAVTTKCDSCGKIEGVHTYCDYCAENYY